MTHTTPDVDVVRDYYCSPRDHGADSRTILEIWEGGEAFDDSITPSTFVPEYRLHMVLKLLTLTGPGARVVSLGCGNAFVEADLAREERAVVALDYLEEAVDLARRKGLEAARADFFDLAPADVADADVLYADGLFGHLIDRSRGMGAVLDQLDALALAPGTLLVVSNDAPRDPDADLAAHERVPGFWFVSRRHLRETLASRGWEILEDYHFPYRRPRSGLRNRTVCVARRTAAVPDQAR